MSNPNPPTRSDTLPASPPPKTSHISDAVRADLGKLDPEHAAHIRKVAGTK